MGMQTFADSIRKNLTDFWSAAAVLGFNRNELIMAADAAAVHFPGYRSRLLRQYASQTGIPLKEIVCFDYYSDAIFPEDCTVFFAAGKASKSGYTVFGKNSDKGGNREFDSDQFYKNRQINVVAYYENPDGSHVVGAAAAGTTGLKMGLNSYGVAVGTNYGYTKLAAKKDLNAVQKLAGDRAQIARDALTEKTALKAAQKTVCRLMEQPMSSSGTLEFADANEVVIVESAYDYVAVKRVRDDVDSRANFFNILSALNSDGNVSSFCRYHRSQELLQEKKGEVTAEILRKISMDHANGPGGNSICRHSTAMDSATLASAIMEIDGVHPEKSVIHIALGTPCNAWADPEGHLSVRMDASIDEIPIEFRNGEVFRKFCLAEPR